MKIIFLGTNGWYDTETGNTVCTLIDSAKFYLILDAGNGIYKIDRFIKEKKPVYLFISHLHIDHIEGLHILNKFKSLPLPYLQIFLGKEIKELNTFVNKPFTVPFDKLPFKAKVNEIKAGKNQLPFSFEVERLSHSGVCFGFRFYIDKKIISYCTDTGVCENDYKLSQKADVLIHESSLKEIDPLLSEWGHTTPDEAAQLAKKSGVKKLVLTHFAADIYLTLKERDVAIKKAKKIFNDIVAAKDNLMIEI